MLCKKCTHCGLCSGDGTFFQNKEIFVETSSKTVFCGIKNSSQNEVALAFDIGTTTVALKAFSLQSGTELFSFGEQNSQLKFAGDVIARINYASSKNGYEELCQSLKNQLEKLISLAMLNVSSKFLSLRKGSPVLKQIVLVGNTVMLSFAAKMTVSTLGKFPFKSPSEFGFEEAASLYFASSFINDSTKIYFAPVVSAFVGGDAVAAVLSSFDFFSEKTQFLADLGTNCEMAVFSKKLNALVFTSSSAGPAFEGQGIECGSPAFSGAITKVFFNQEDKKFFCSVIGDLEAKSICGTGLISAVSEGLKSNLIDFTGRILFENGAFSGKKIYLSKEVFISQKDIRNLQLAKSAVKTGLSFLGREIGETNPETSILYLAGGFGEKLDKSAAFSIKLFPAYLKNIVHCGNAALSGATLLFDEKYRDQAKKIAQNSKTINLAESEKFQEAFIENLNF